MAWLSYLRRIFFLCIALFLCSNVSAQACSIVRTFSYLETIENYKYVISVPKQEQTGYVVAEMTVNPDQGLEVVSDTIDPSSYSYTQPFEYKPLYNDPARSSSGYTLTFLAAANTQYKIFYNDLEANSRRSKTWELPATFSPVQIKLPPAELSSDYFYYDLDNDGVPNSDDICRDYPNPAQIYDQQECDYNNNGIRDAQEDCAPRIPENIPRQNITRKFCASTKGLSCPDSYAYSDSDFIFFDGPC